MKVFADKVLKYYIVRMVIMSDILNIILLMALVDKLLKNAIVSIVVMSNIHENFKCIITQSCIIGSF